MKLTISYFDPSNPTSVSSKPLDGYKGFVWDEDEYSINQAFELLIQNYDLVDSEDSVIFLDRIIGIKLVDKGALIVEEKALSEAPVSFQVFFVFNLLVLSAFVLLLLTKQALVAFAVGAIWGLVLVIFFYLHSFVLDLLVRIEKLEKENAKRRSQKEDA